MTSGRSLCYRDAKLVNATVSRLEAVSRTGSLRTIIMSSSVSRRALFEGLGAALALPAIEAADFVGAPTASTIARGGNSYVNSRKVLLWENTRKEFREAIEGGVLKAVIVPCGSCEQHNEHLAMIHDTASVTLVAHQAALQLYPQVMLTPPVSVGISPHWMDRKGTLSLRRETFLAVVFDICDSLKTHGVRNILILNGHGGNQAPLAQSVEEFRSKLGINIQAHSYWRAYSAEIIKKYMESGVVPGHAAEFETSFAMAAFPERVHWEGVDYEKAKPLLHIKDPASAKEEEKFAREAKLASTAKGEAMIAIAMNWVADQLRQMSANAAA